MKKFLVAILSAILTVCVCLPLVACGDGENEQPRGERKKIIAIDSEKPYIKAHWYLEHNRDLIGKTISFEFLSYDYIKEDELLGVSFDIKTGDKFELVTDNFTLRTFDQPDSKGVYRNNVIVDVSMRCVTYDVRINSITLNISGEEYTFKTDIYFLMHNYRPVFVEPQLYSYSTGDAEKGPYSIYIITLYDMTLKSLKFQTEGFEILSYYVEVYNSDTNQKEKVTEELPVKIEAGKKYQIFVEAIPPQDCLYYGVDIEATLEISGVEIMYNNVDDITDTLSFLGSALNDINY